MFLRRRRNVQVGRGIGSILSGLIRGFGPLAKTIGQSLFGLGKKAVKSNTTKEIIKSAAKDGLTAGVNVAKDIIKGENLSKSVEKNLIPAVDSIVSNASEKIEKAIDKATNNRKRSATSSSEKQVPNKKKKDMFS